MTCLTDERGMIASMGVTFVRRSVPRILALLALVLVVALMIVPHSAIEFLRSEYSWLGGAADFMETAAPGIDLDHLVAFGVLGFALFFGLPRRRGWQIAAALLAIATLTEILQIWIPGRNPMVMHAWLDVIGGLAGYGWAWLLVYAIRPEHTLRQSRGSS
jgi:hypothetical protein